MTSATEDQVRRLLQEFPEEMPLLAAACTQAQKCEPGDFAGSWVLAEMARQTGEPAWRPGMRRLAAFGLIEKTHSARGGRRAYWRMPDRAAVEQALAEAMSPR